MEIERAQQQSNVGTGTLGKDGSMAVINPPSFVSNLHELANKHRIEVNFETIDENGPAHVKRFRVKCRTGDKEVLGIFIYFFPLSILVRGA